MDKKIAVLITGVCFLILFGGILLSSKSSSTSNLGRTVNIADLNGDARHAKGNPEAKVTVVEVADFQCPACAQAHPYIKALVDAHPDDLYFVYRHFPLSQHKNAFTASEASEAAGDQGKFWEMYDILYQKQSDWEGSDASIDKFTEYAKELGLNTEQFKKDLTDHKFKDIVQKDLDNGIKIGINSTPTFFINGKEYTGNFTYIKSVVEGML